MEKKPYLMLTQIYVTMQHRYSAQWLNVPELNQNWGTDAVWIDDDYSPVLAYAYL